MRVFRSVFVIVVVVLFWGGCGDDVIFDQAQPVTVADVTLEPAHEEERVPIDHELLVIFDRVLGDDEVDRLTATVNGSEASDIVHTQTQTTSILTVVPSIPLEYHKIYTVAVSSTDPVFDTLEWRFATDPGPTGVLWERADASAGIDLYDIGVTSTGYMAVGGGGAVLTSPLAFGWREDVGAVGVGGQAQSEDLVWLWSSSSSAGGVTLTDQGAVYVGRLSIGLYMEEWTPPSDLHVRGIWSYSTVTVGSLRSDPGVGFISSSSPGSVTQTGSGRVMWDASAGYDGQPFYLAVGEGGSVFFSRDRSVWDDVNHQPSWGSFECVVGGYPGATPASQVPRVSVAGGNILAWSDDGRAWQPATAGTHGVVRDISWDGYPIGEYLAVGDDGTILRSTDGRVWDAVDTGLDLTGVNFYAAVTYRWDRWVVVGENGATIVTPPAPIRF